VVLRTDSRCHLLLNFFAHLGSNVGDLFDQVFFLVYYGKNYDYTAVMDMPTDERIWNIQRLHHQLMEEKKAHEEAMREAKRNSANRPRRR